MRLFVSTKKVVILAALLGGVAGIAGEVYEAKAQSNAFQLEDDGVEISEDRLAAAEERLLQRIGGQNQANQQNAAAAAKQEPQEPEPIKVQVGSKPASEPRASLRQEAPKAIPVVQKPALQEEEEHGPSWQNKVIGAVSQEIAGEVESLHGQNTSLKNKTKSLTKSVTDLQSSNMTLQQRLDASEKRAEMLLDKMKQMRDDLIVAETEVERLSSIIQERNNTTLSRYSGQADLPPQTNHVRHQNYLMSPQQREKASEQMEIATVLVDKANLRLGPGKDNETLLTVSKGTRLPVENRVSDWYRVVTPTGERAWISADVVAFGRNRLSGPTRTVSVKGYDGTVDEIPHEFISKRSGS